MQELLFCQSAGLSAVEGSPASEYAVQVMAEAGYDLSRHRSRKICADDMSAWDLYFPMTATHAYILEQAGVPVNKIYIPKEIFDPYGMGVKEYRSCRDILEKEVRLFYNDKVQRQLIVESHQMQPFLGRGENPRKKMERKWK